MSVCNIYGRAFGPVNVINQKCWMWENRLYCMIPVTLYIIDCKETKHAYKYLQLTADLLQWILMAYCQMRDSLLSCIFITFTGVCNIYMRTFELVNFINSRKCWNEKMFIIWDWNQSVSYWYQIGNICIRHYIYIRSNAAESFLLVWNWERYRDMIELHS